jgi:hypothetical protein
MFAVAYAAASITWPTGFFNFIGLSIFIAPVGAVRLHLVQCVALNTTTKGKRACGAPNDFANGIFGFVDDGGEWTPEHEDAHISYARSQKSHRWATSPPTLSSSSIGTLDRPIAADFTFVGPLGDEMFAALGSFVGLARVLVALLWHGVPSYSGSAIAAASGLLLLGKKCRYGMPENLPPCF